MYCPVCQRVVKEKHYNVDKALCVECVDYDNIFDNPLWCKNYHKQLKLKYQGVLYTGLKKDIGPKFYTIFIWLTGKTPEDMREYLEEKFSDGMSWENYGNWHVDHIRPVSSFNLLNTKEICECWNWQNLQPLWKFDNLSKRDKWDGAFPWYVKALKVIKEPLPKYRSRCADKATIYKRINNKTATDVEIQIFRNACSKYFIKGEFLIFEPKRLELIYSIKNNIHCQQHEHTIATYNKIFEFLGVDRTSLFEPKKFLDKALINSINDILLKSLIGEFTDKIKALRSALNIIKLGLQRVVAKKNNKYIIKGYNIVPKKFWDIVKKE